MIRGFSEIQAQRRHCQGTLPTIYEAASIAMQKPPPELFVTTNSPPTTLPSSRSHRLGYGCALMNVLTRLASGSVGIGLSPDANRPHCCLIPRLRVESHRRSRALFSAGRNRQRPSTLRHPLSHSSSPHANTARWSVASRATLPSPHILVGNIAGQPRKSSSVI